MADDPFLDRHPADDNDALDPDLTARFRLLESLTPPDTWPRRTGAATAEEIGSDRSGERPWWLLVAAAAVVVAGVAALQLGPTGTTSVDVADAGTPTCPVTVAPEAGFEPPEPWPATPSAEEYAWYGTKDLWTVIDRGEHAPRKGVWWSANFPGGAEEEQPQLHITYRRLGSDEPTIVFGGPGTNAYTVQDGDFMINGIEPEAPGCWLATATYKGATLSYVYEVG